jgi:ABC-type amino acid transport substrate-binding protein
MADVFISYKREDRDKAEALANFLATKNYSVWWDTSLQAGESFSDVIEKQIDGAKKVVVLWTKASIASYWVRAEAARGLQQNKLVAACLETCDLPLPFTQIHTATLEKFPDDFEKLLKPIAAAATIFESDVRAAPDGRTPAIRHRFRVSRRHAMIAATVLPFLAIAYFAVSLLRPPVPEWQIERAVFIGEPIPLKWIYAARRVRNPDGTDSDSAVSFEVEYDIDSLFASPDKRSLHTEGRQRPVQHINGSRYWRLRAVDDRNKSAISAWSLPLRITQYDSSYRRIEATSTVIVGVSDTDYDDVFKWKDKRWHGVDISLSEAIATQLSARIGWRIELKIVPIPWKELLDQPGSGQVDMIVSAISKRSDRRDKHRLDFSDTYFCTTQALLHRVGETVGQIATAIAGKRIGYQDDTTSERLVTELKGKQQFESRNFHRPEDMIYAVVNNEIDYAIVDAPFAADAIRLTRQRGANRLDLREFSPEDFPDKFPMRDRFDEYAIAIRAGDELLPIVNEILQKLKGDGTLADMFRSAAREFEQAKGSGAQGGSQALLRERPWECRR